MALNFRISGNFLSALIEVPSCSVDINQSLSDWFHVDSGGCILSPTLFATFIDDLMDDDLMEDIKATQADVQCGEDRVSGLMYTGDAVVIAPDESRLQKLIDVIVTWCKR